MAISNIGNTLSQQFMLSVLRGDLDESQRQSSTGKKSNTIAGMGGAVSASISSRSRISLLDTYTANLNVAKTKFDISDKAMSSITDTTREMINQLRSQLQGTPPQATVLSDTAKANLKSIADKLNTQVEGRYVFSGVNSTSITFDNMTELLTNIGTVVSAALVDPLTTSATVITSAQAVLNADLGLSGAGVFGGAASFRADDNTTITYSVKGGANGFADIVRGMAIIANLPQPTNAQEQNNYWDMVNSAITLMESGATAVDGYQAQAGTQAKIVDKLIATHSETRATLEEYIGSLEDVDMADAATRFSSLKTQLETSYSIIATMKDLSLVKYL